MKFTKQDLLTMLIGLFLFASCKDSKTIGLDLDESFEIKGVFMDTATVKSQTLKDDVTSGVGLIRHPLGFMTDPVFGETDASLAMAVGVPSTSYSFGKYAAIDSAVLVLPYSTQFYGDTTTSIYEIKVNQLSNDISKETSYLIDKVWPANNVELGKFTGKIKPNTKFKISDVVSGKQDTLRSVVPQIRIKLDTAFIGTNIVRLDSAKLSTANNFYKALKGFKVTATKSGGSGGIIFLNFSGTEGKLELYYKKQNTTTPTARDTVSINFPIGNNYGPVTASIAHNYTSTPVKTQLDNPNTAYPVTYLQALAGLKNKISFPYLKNFIADIKDPLKNPGATANTKLIVNKAELVIDLTDGNDAVPFSAAQRLALYRYDIAGQRANVPDNDNSIQGSYNGDPRALGSDVLFGGYFDSVNRRYLFTITSYIQDLLDGKTQDYGTFLAPSSLTEFNVNPPVTSAARSVVSSYKKPTLPTDKRMRLNIYYTQIN